MTDARDRHIQLIAWAVLLAAFACFAALVLGGPVLALRYVENATVAQHAEVGCKSGSCALAFGSGIPRVVRPGTTVPPVAEGYTVSTDGTARALVRFFDGSTANLDHDTALALRRMRRARFSLGRRERELALAVRAPAPGTTSRLLLGTTWGDVRFVVDTPFARVMLDAESHARVEVDATRLSVTGVEGRATVTSEQGSVTVGADQRTLVLAGAAPSPPLVGGEDIVANSDFTKPLDVDDAWNYRLVVPGGGDDDPGIASWAVLDDGRTVVRIVREGSGGRPADMVYEQSLGEYDVSAARRIEVRVRLRVLAQSLPLGGMRGTELPAMVKLVGEAANGDQIAWSVGFYGVEPDPAEPESKYVLDAEVVNVKVAPGEWSEFDSGNLLDADNDKGFEHLGQPLPARLTRLEIIASGHDYASDIDAVEVWVK